MIFFRKNFRLNLFMKGPKAKNEVKTSSFVINIKSEGKDPEIKSYKEYPLWLFQLAENKPNLKQSVKLLHLHDYNEIGYKDTKRLKKLIKKHKIKENNVNIKFNKSRQLDKAQVPGDDPNENIQDGGLFLRENKKEDKKKKSKEDEDDDEDDYIDDED